MYLIIDLSLQHMLISLNVGGYYRAMLLPMQCHPPCFPVSFLPCWLPWPFACGSRQARCSQVASRSLMVGRGEGLGWRRH